MSKPIALVIVGGFVGITALSVLFGTFYTVDQGELGVVTRTGAIHRVVDPGFHVKIPFVESVNTISLRTFTVNYDDVPVYSRDIQSADTRWSVTYQIDPSKVEFVYENYRTARNAIDVVLTPRFADAARSVFGQYNAVNVVSQRNQLTNDALEKVREATAGTGIVVTSIQMENVDFSAEYERSIEERMKAEVEVERFRQNLAREKVSADIVRTQAEAEADRVRFAAEAEAERIREVGEAEATAIKARGEALQNNPALIQLISAERWNGELPRTMVPDSTVPFLNMTPAEMQRLQEPATTTNR